MVRDLLLRTDRSGAAVRFTRPEGVSAEGLARGGSDAGPAGDGLCETCHVHTRYFDRSAAAAPHRTEWCVRCHEHGRGFQPRR